MKKLRTFTSHANLAKRYLAIVNTDKDYGYQLENISDIPKNWLFARGGFEGIEVFTFNNFTVIEL